MNQQITNRKWFKNSFAVRIFFDLILSNEITSKTDCFVGHKQDFVRRYNKSWPTIKQAMDALSKENDINIVSDGRDERFGKIYAIRITSDCIKFE